MRINCSCGEIFDWSVVETFPFNNDKYAVRKPCPECRRGYELSVRLIPEKENWGSF